MSLCLISLNYFSGSTATQINDFDNGHHSYTINENKESVAEPDVRPAAVMNHCTLEGVVHFYDHGMNCFKKHRVINIFPIRLCLKLPWFRTLHFAITTNDC